MTRPYQSSNFMGSSVDSQLKNDIGVKPALVSEFANSRSK